MSFLATWKIKQHETDLLAPRRTLEREKERAFTVVHAYSSQRLIRFDA